MVVGVGGGDVRIWQRPAVHAPPHDWLRDDYTRPAGPIEDVVFPGRHCWAVDLAPGRHENGVLRTIVDIETGALHASIAAGFASGVLARRPRSDEPWELRRHGAFHRRSTDDFDWPAMLHRAEFDTDTLTAVQDAPHPGEPVTTD